MAATVGIVTETPGTITSDGVKLPIDNRSQTEIYIDGLVQSVRSLPLPSETISGFMIETSKMKGYQVIGYLEAILNEYKPRHPAPATGGPTAISSADVKAIPYGVTIDEADQDPEYKVWTWAWEKLGRFPDGLPLHRLWSDAPIGIKNLGDRDIFTARIQTAIDVGLILSDGDGKLLANPDLEP
jgi:hypothetical protein